MKYLILVLLTVFCLYGVEITVDASQGRKPISPYIYGKNNSLSDNSSSPLSANSWELFRQAGLKMFRENGGNNATKYNWRRKLSSHPDWYNNVYAHDWDYEAQSLQDNMPDARGMWAFQLIGYAAANNQNNFNDWVYNGSQWWEGVANNWAGGGGPSEGEGDPELYLMEWPPDSTVGILDQWFGDTGLGFEEERFQYWNMDNEVEIWNNTHDDVMPTAISAEAYMQRFFDVAKKARAKFPEIKIVGPVPCNEWFWYNWSDGKVDYNGSSYPWLEYFILRIAEEQDAAGIHLLDVLDVHFYPSESNADEIVQLHRIWFDEAYDYPGANGVKVTDPSGWNNNITNEYIFGRCGAWLEQYIGADHGVTFSVSETGLNTDDPDVVAVWYASNLGVFADNGIEFFTPWEWENEMWEVLHLFSRYAKNTRVISLSEDEETVSAYSSINSAGDSLTVILVNRLINSAQDVNVKIDDFSMEDGIYEALMLNDLSENMTFISHTNNALEEGTVSVVSDSFNITLPSLSITAVILNGEGTTSAVEASKPQDYDFTLHNYPNPFNPITTILYSVETQNNMSQQVDLSIYNVLGQKICTLVSEKQKAGRYQVEWNASGLNSGVFIVQLISGLKSKSKKILLVK
ncbi:MAG: T9SS type A sorting domain-containing protein [Calditrichaceae bacterium]|nr:T9SS type A sorting domain-containing protein [Calditrichaceae bacterium]